MNNDKKKYDDFISKIIIDYKNIKSIKERHSKEKKIKENKIEDLNNQINFFSKNTQEEKAQSKIYRSQVEEYNSNEKAYTQKDINFEGQRKKLSNEIINKEKKIKNLTNELEKLRNLIKKYNTDELINYVNTTKQNAENNSKSSESHTSI